MLSQHRNQPPHPLQWFFQSAEHDWYNNSTKPTSKCNSLNDKLPQFPVTAPDWLCTFAEEILPTLCSDPIMSSQVQQQVGDLAQQMNLRIMQMISLQPFIYPSP